MGVLSFTKDQKATSGVTSVQGRGVITTLP